MSAQPRSESYVNRKLTVEEYLAFDATSVEKYDFVDGYLEPALGMAGGTMEQSALNANIIANMHFALRGKPCRVFDSNLKVRIGRKQKYRYPDALVVCGRPEFDEADTQKTTVLNPTLIVEVLSESSRLRDMNTKFSEYREISAFREYVVVEQTSPDIVAYYKQDDGTWLFTPASGMDASVRLRSIDIELHLKDVYAGIEFVSKEPENAPAPPL
jgi:Uma2 family endonuclease